MIYKDVCGQRLSYLGMGNMRLPTTETRGPIDEAAARKMIERAYEGGINYFDTAYRYHGGQSELFVGEVLKQYPRDTWYLATKLPGHMMRYENGQLGFQGYLSGEKIASIGEIFEDQLKRCQVDYFDFYLLHNVCETSYDFYTDEALGVVDYLLEQKAAGRIRHLGISAHGRADTIDRFLTWCGEIEFVQLQLNYMDWVLQDAKAKYDVVTRHGLPIIAMEPVRGGGLIHLPEAAQAMLRNADPEATNAAWAMRFLQSLPNVKVVLSGMTMPDQLAENLALFGREAPLSAQGLGLLDEVVKSMADLVPCTACRYCVEDCPQGLDIPKLISMYNEASYDNGFTLQFTLGAMGEAERPGACVACGACSRVCPQGIDIPGVMERFAAILAKQA